MLKNPVLTEKRSQDLSYFFGQSRSLTKWLTWPWPKGFSTVVGKLVAAAYIHRITVITTVTVCFLLYFKQTII